MDTTWIITILIAATAFYLTTMWLKIRSFPPGPIPLPLIGNMLSFRTDKHPFLVLDRFRRIYGDIFTLWLGSEPVVFICNWQLLKEALITKSRDFINRRIRLMFEIQMGGHDNILFSNGSNWICMRKIATSAIRKYSVSEKFRELVCNSMDEMLEKMKKESQPFDPEELVYLTVHNVIAYSAFGARHDQKDQEFVELKEVSCNFVDEAAVGLPSDFIPILRPFFWHRERRLRRGTARLNDILRKKYTDHVESYQTGEIRDFCDAIIAARQDEENLDCAHLTDDNFINILSDLFIAGTHTTLSSLLWLILLVSNFEDVQKKIANEIDDIIGYRMPSQEDKAKCHYTSAVIMEAQRFRTVAPLGVDHAAACDSEIGGFPIKKGTTIIFSLISNHIDAEIWPKPHEFRPERFLEKDGSICKIRKDGYVPFSAGRRNCAGEKLATTEIFLAIVRILQQSTLSLPKGAGTGNLDPKEMIFFSLPKSFKICLKPRGHCGAK